MTKAYLHKNFCGLGDRIIIHPMGLPPGWTESGLTAEQEKLLSFAQCGLAVALMRGQVLHFNENVELIEALPLQ